MDKNESKITWKGVKKQIMEFTKSIGSYHVGLLYGDNNKLMLTDLKGREVYELWESDKFDDTLWAIEFVNNDIYFGGADKKITRLFEGKIYERSDSIHSILNFNNKVYDAGSYGIIETESNRTIVSKDEMENENISCIDTLFKTKYKDKDMLACGVTYKDNTHGIWVVDVENHKLLKEIRRYEKKLITLTWQAFYWNGDIVSCVYKEYLTINDERIKNTEINIFDGNISRVVPVIDKNGKEWFYYSGFDLDSIRRYNLKREKVKKILKRKVSDVYALKPVTKSQWNLIFKRYKEKFGREPERNINGNLEKSLQG